MDEILKQIMGESYKQDMTQEEIQAFFKNQVLGDGKYVNKEMAEAEKKKLQDALEICDMTTDVVEVIDRGKKYWQDVAEQNLELQKKTQEVLQSNNNQNQNQNKAKENTGYKSTTYNNNMNKISEKHNKKEEK